MPRNSSGVHQLPNGALATPNTVIQSTAFNAFAQDVSNELTGSLPRDGRAGMTGPQRLASGALGVGGVSFTESPASGLWWDPSRSALVLSVAGIELAVFTASGIAAPGIMKPGTLFVFAGAAAPLGSLLAYGQAVSRTNYAALFAALGTIHGAGDGSTTFNIPDCRGVVLGGLDNMGGADAQRLLAAGGNRNSLGALVGVDGVTLGNGHLPSPLPNGSVTVSYPSHTYRRSNEGNQPASNGAGGQTVITNLGSQDQQTSPPGAQTFGVSNPNPGGNQAHLNVQPTRLYNICIQA